MTSPVETVPVGTSLAEAARRMRDEDISSLLVEGDSYAILTSTDVLDVVANGNEIAELSASDAATDLVVTAEPDQPLTQAAATMLSHGSSHLPVIEDGELVGILSKTDITKDRAD
jgi:CBS domain-containing protein